MLIQRVNIVFSIYAKHATTETFFASPETLKFWGGPFWKYFSKELSQFVRFDKWDQNGPPYDIQFNVQYQLILNQATWPTAFCWVVSYGWWKDRQQIQEKEKPLPLAVLGIHENCCWWGSSGSLIFAGQTLEILSSTSYFLVPQPLLSLAARSMAEPLWTENYWPLKRLWDSTILLG